MHALALTDLPYGKELDLFPIVRRENSLALQTTLGGYCPSFFLSFFFLRVNYVTCYVIQDKYPLPPPQ